MARRSHRNRIVESGLLTVQERGFVAAGVRDITAAAGVPQGSFTNHFRSKEAFGVILLDRYFENLQQVIEHTLRDQTRRPTDRLRAYFDEITASFQAIAWRRGCLIGNMSLEAAEHSESIRAKLVEIFAAWTPAFAEAIRASQDAGEVSRNLDANEAAAALLDAWHGALLRMKVERDPAPLDRFIRLVLPGVLQITTRTD